MAVMIDRVRTLHAVEFMLEHGWKGVWATKLSSALRFGDEIRNNLPIVQQRCDAILM